MSRIELTTKPRTWWLGRTALKYRALDDGALNDGALNDGAFNYGNALC